MSTRDEPPQSDDKRGTQEAVILGLWKAEPIPSIFVIWRYPSAIRSLQLATEARVQQSVTALSVPRARHDPCLASPLPGKRQNICYLFHENHVQCCAC